MGYKALGFVVWQGGKWWMRRKLSGRQAKLAVAGLGVAGVAVLGGAIAAGRQAGGDE